MAFCVLCISRGVRGRGKDKTRQGLEGKQCCIISNYEMINYWESKVYQFYCLKLWDHNIVSDIVNINKESYNISRLNCKWAVITRSGIQPASLFTIFIVFASHIPLTRCVISKDKLSYEENIWIEVLFPVVRHRLINKPSKMDHPQHVSQWSGACSQICSL